ncbi:hypothetical protein ACFX1Z_045078 [Malus domestica]
MTQQTTSNKLKGRSDVWARRFRVWELELEKGMEPKCRKPAELVGPRLEPEEPVSSSGGFWGQPQELPQGE